MDTVGTYFMNNAEFEKYLIDFAQEMPKTAPINTGFTTSFLAILVSEIGDKTFFLAMIMALRYSQVVVFTGSYGALFLMTVLSTAFGKIATSWISPLFTNIIVTILFFYFGIKMLIDAKNHEQAEENQELKEVQHELKEMEMKYIQQHSQQGEKLIETESPTSKKKKLVIPNTYILGQAFLMTFLAEWGDRSQIATVALAASFNPYMVTFGALLGHFLCTAAAVKIGEWISGRVSQKKVLTVGGIVFIISGICTGVLAINQMSD